jgi:hypothetical protein
MAGGNARPLSAPRPKARCRVIVPGVIGVITGAVERQRLSASRRNVDEKL